MIGVLHRKIFYSITCVVLIGALAAIFILGLPFGIDFTGGSLMEVSYTDERPEKESVEDVLGEMSLGVYSLREAGENGYVLRTLDISEEEHQSIKSALTNLGALTEDRYTSIGPTIGQELRAKAIWAFLAVVLAVSLYVAIAFRKVSKPVSSLWYGSIVIVALLHDIIVPLGVFSILGALFGIELDVLFLTAVLVILGYSINDTVIIFDRIRERISRNQNERRKEEFDITVGSAVSDTYGRSINTSLTTLFALTAIYVLGGTSTQFFALTLIIGVLAGTYSSLFLAAPLLVTIEKWQSKRKLS